MNTMTKHGVQGRVQLRTVTSRNGKAITGSYASAMQAGEAPAILEKRHERFCTCRSVHPPWTSRFEPAPMKWTP